MPSIISKPEIHVKARIRANGGTHTDRDVLRQYDAQNGECFYCQVPLQNKYHVDHRIPVSRGGSNGPENLVCACGPCNLRKHTKTDVEFLAFLEGGAQKSDPLQKQSGQNLGKSCDLLAP